MNEAEREELMVRMYGEVCTKTAAARMLARSTNTITAMLEDGRLGSACEGTRVDVRSIARYIAQPKQKDEVARQRRIRMRYKSSWSV